MNHNLNTDLRKECLQKIKHNQLNLGTSTSPELIERQCFEMAKNNVNEYKKMIDATLNRPKQQQNISNYQHNILGHNTTNSTPNSDPLNALQNLTVSAGQAGQMIVPSASANNRMNPTMYNSQVRQRSLATNNLQRPTIPQLPLQTSVTAQMNQLSQGPSSMGSHVSNTHVARLPNKSIVIKGDVALSHSPSMSSSIGLPYSLEPGLTPASGQQIFSNAGQRPAPNKLYQHSPSVQTMQHVSQHTPRSVPSITINQSSDVSKPTTSTASINKPAIPISEEESKKVFEEIKKLKEKYLKTVKSILVNRKRYPEKEVKVWKVLEDILENPEGISKPLTLNHITKIEQHLMKAEHSLAIEDNHSAQSTSIPNSSLVHQTSNLPKQIPSNRKTIWPCDDSSNQKFKYKAEATYNATESMNTSSLDIAFDEVFHQLMTADKETLKRVQKGLVKYVESKRHIYSHFLPKRLFSEDSEDDHSKGTAKRQRLVSVFDEDEFNYLDDLVDKKQNSTSRKYPLNILDKHGLLRTNLIFDKDEINEYNIENEMEILRKEFEIEDIEQEVISNEWCTYDNEWGDSLFYSITYQSQNLPEPVPPLKIRIPGDYSHCQYVDWNLNDELYSPECGFFLEYVRCVLVENFSKINQYVQWSGVPLVHVASVYKQSILTANTKYQNHIDQIKF